MKKQHILAVTIFTLVVISGGIVFSACTSITSAGKQDNFSAQVGTAAAATLVQHMIETQVATLSAAMAVEPVAQLQPTNTPDPTATAIPTQTAPPTVAAPPAALQPSATPLPTATPVPASSDPRIIADLNTNCRLGPSTRYAIQTVFAQGSESKVQGIDSAKNWWYIVNPTSPGGFCWVWEGSTTVVGDTSTLPVVQPPAAPQAWTPNLWYGYSPYASYSEWCGYDKFGNYYCNDHNDDYEWVYCTCGYYPWCKPNQKNCYPENWWKNNPYGYCPCIPIYQDPCKKSSCPPVTIVNYKNYCKNYPNCCDKDK